MGKGLYHALALQASHDSSEDLIKELSNPTNAQEATLIVHQQGDLKTLTDQLSNIGHSIFVQAWEEISDKPSSIPAFRLFPIKSIILSVK